MTEAEDSPDVSDATGSSSEYDASEVSTLASPATRFIAERLRIARRFAKMTQKELAGDDFSKSYVSAIECGKMIPSLPALTTLAQRLHCPVAYLLGEDNIESPDFDRVLAEAEVALRRDQPLQALEHLGPSEEPLPYLSAATRLTWYAYAGWARGMAGRGDDAFRLLQQAKELADSPQVQAANAQNSRLATAVEYVYCMLGNAYCDRGEHEQAYAYHKRVLRAIHVGTVTDPLLKLLVYKGLGLDTFFLARYYEAILYYKKAVEQAQNLENPRQQGLAYWGLALAYQEQSDPFHAKAGYQKALMFLEETENKRNLALIRALLGQALVNLGEYEKAEPYLKQSLEEARTEGDTYVLGVALGNTAVLHNARGDVDQAIQLATEALQMTRKSGDQRSEGHLFFVFATSYAAKNDLIQAEQSLRKAIEIAQVIPDLDMLSQAYDRFAAFLEAQGRVEEAVAQMHLAAAPLQVSPKNANKGAPDRNDL